MTTTRFLRRVSAAAVAACVTVTLAGAPVAASEDHRPIQVVSAGSSSTVVDTVDVSFYLAVTVPDTYETVQLLLKPGTAGAGEVPVVGACVPAQAVGGGTYDVTCSASAEAPGAPGLYRATAAFTTRDVASGLRVTTDALATQFRVPEPTGTGGDTTNPGDGDGGIWTTKACAHSVTVTRRVPGKGETQGWGKRMQAGKRVVVSQRYAHKPGTAGKVACQRQGTRAYKAVGKLAVLNRMVWGTRAGLHRSSRAPVGTRPGVYQYRAVAKAVACTVEEGAGITGCTRRPQVALVTTYRVTVDRARWVSWTWQTTPHDVKVPDKPLG